MNKKNQISDTDKNQKKDWNQGIPWFLFLFVLSCISALILLIFQAFFPIQ